MEARPEEEQGPRGRELVGVDRGLYRIEGPVQEGEPVPVVLLDGPEVESGVGRRDPHGRAGHRRVVEAEGVPELMGHHALQVHGVHPAERSLRIVAPRGGALEEADPPPVTDRDVGLGDGGACGWDGRDDVGVPVAWPQRSPREEGVEVRAA